MHAMRSVSFFASIELRIFGLVTSTLLAIYGVTTSNHITLGDAGDLIAAAKMLGIAHPPGYPTFTLLGFLFSKILWFLEPAYLINLMNALFGALAAGVLGVLSWRLFSNWPVAVFTGLSLGLTSSVWSLATSTEVYTLNLLFNNLLWLLAIEFRKARRPRTFYAFCWILGLALTNSYPLILLTGLGMILIFPKDTYRPKLLLRGSLYGLLGLSPYLYLVIQAMRAGQIDYVFMDLSGIDSVVPFILRSQYLFLDQKSSPLVEKIYVLGLLVWSVLKDFSLASLFLGTGIFAAFKTRWEYRWPFLTATFTSSVLLFILLGTTSNTLEFAVFYDYVLPTLACLVIFAALGMNWIVERYSKSQRFLACAGVLALVTQAVYAFPVANYYGDNTVEAWSKNVFASLPENASLVICSDLSMPLKYLQLLKGVRKDVTLYTGYIGLEDRKWYYFVRSRDIAQSIRSASSIEDLMQQEGSPVYTLDCAARFLQEGLTVVLKGLAYQLVSERFPERAGLPLTKPDVKPILDSIHLGPPEDHYWMNRLRQASTARILTYASKLSLLSADELDAQVKAYGYRDDPRFLAVLGAELAFAGNYALSLKYFNAIGMTNLAAGETDDIAVYCRLLIGTENLDLAQSVCAVADKPSQVCNADAKYNLGRAYWKVKAESLRFLKAATRCNPSSTLLRETLERRESEP